MKKNIVFFFAVLSTGLFLSGCINNNLDTGDEQASQSEFSSAVPEEKGESMKTINDFEKMEETHAVISTTKGDIEVELYPNRAPVTVASFLTLSKNKFYDGIIVHRVEPEFVIQAGDPQTKEEGKESLWGTGGPGYTIPDEFSEDFSFDTEGVLAMAKTAMPNSGGSQFFITLGPATFLDAQYTVFGKVTKGMDIVKKIEVGDKIVSITVQ